jgi:hypothetical protein
MFVSIASHGHPKQLSRLEHASRSDEGLYGGQNAFDHGLCEDQFVCVPELVDEELPQS